jgi:transposase
VSLARIHARAANLRRDALHKLTTSLATQHGTIVVEQLNLAGMARIAYEACGVRLDRDLNAARNLVKLAQHVTQVAGRR